MVEDGKQIYDIYKVTIKRQPDIKKIIILMLLIFVAIGLIMIAKNSGQLMNQYKVYKQYEAQLIALKKQEEDKQITIQREKERIRQERIPKLTQKRKK